MNVRAKDIDNFNSNTGLILSGVQVDGTRSTDRRPWAGNIAELQDLNRADWNMFNEALTTVL